jgi:hypothetical protein
MHRTDRTMQTALLLTVTMGVFLLGCERPSPETTVVPPVDQSGDEAKLPLAPEPATQLAGKSEADQVAIWESKVGKPVTLEGFAIRGKDGVRLRPTGTGVRFPYGIKLHNVLRELRGGQGTTVRVTGTLQLDKHVWTKADVEKYHRDLAHGYKQMQMRLHLKAEDVDRNYYISDAVVTRLATPPTKPADVGKVSE